MKKFFEKKQNIVVLSFSLLIIIAIVSVIIIKTNVSQDVTSNTNSTQTEKITMNTTVFDESSSANDENIENESITYNQEVNVTTPSKTQNEHTTIKNNISTTQKNDSVILPPVDSDAEYSNQIADLDFEYNNRKFDIENSRDNDMVSNKLREQSLSAEIASLQNQCYQEKNSIQQEINELNRKKVEAEAMGATNSYYASLARQYESQIATKQAQLNNVDSKYGAKISQLKNEMDSIPTQEERKAQADLELESLDNWYANEVKKLKNIYGK